MTTYLTAISDFRRARRRAVMQKLLARLKGESIELLPYEQVRKQLHARQTPKRTLKEIPLDAIIGSVDRYMDFSRTFLPLQDSDLARWARVRVGTEGLTGLPPIEVYQIGQAYFVGDGHHRVSVAKELGAKYIQAYVTEVQTKVPLTADVDPEQLLLHSQYANFLQQTQIDQIRPDSDLRLTAPGAYDELLEHIEVHRYFMGLEQNREIPYAEAVVHWYDQIYLPLIHLVRQLGILQSFPERTEADLYLWISRHRAELQNEFGWEVDPPTAASDLVVRHGKDTIAKSSTTKARLRAEASDEIRESVLFPNLLVPLTGTDAGWEAVKQALTIAQREKGRLLGLHVLAQDAPSPDAQLQALQTQFAELCQAANIPGQLALGSGTVADQICQRSRVSDLIVVQLSHPPGRQPLASLSSGINKLIQDCPVPVLALPKQSDMRNALLAYDASPRANEALFIGTYLASKWGISLSVITVAEGGKSTENILARARHYLEGHGVSALFVQAQPPTSQAILRTCHQQGHDLILLGAYGHTPLVKAVLGSTVDHVLRHTHVPVLICH